MKINIKPCYEIWIEDEDGNTEESEYVYMEQRAVEAYVKEQYKDHDEIVWW